MNSKKTNYRESSNIKAHASTNSKKTNYRESSNIKAHASVHWRAHCHAKWPRGGKEFQHPQRIEPMSPDSLEIALTTEPWVHIDLLWKKVHDSRYLATWNQPLLCMQDCCSRIALVEYQGQTWYSSILQCKPLIDTSYGILHRLEFYL